MSNYPPGVSGNEPQIAGLPEGRRWVECKNTIVVMHEAPPATKRNGKWIWMIGETDEVDCPFAGEADVVYTGRGKDWFEYTTTCPLCGQEIYEYVEKD